MRSWPVPPSGPGALPERSWPVPPNIDQNSSTGETELIFKHFDAKAVENKILFPVGAVLIDFLGRSWPVPPSGPGALPERSWPAPLRGASLERSWPVPPNVD